MSAARGGRQGKQLPLAVEKMPTFRISRLERETLIKFAGLHWGPEAGQGEGQGRRGGRSGSRSCEATTGLGEGKGVRSQRRERREKSRVQRQLEIVGSEGDTTRGR